MRVVDGSPGPYELASPKVAQPVVAVGLVGPLGLAAQFCYFYFEVCTVLLHLYNGLGLLISDLNYSQA